MTCSTLYLSNTPSRNYRRRSSYKHPNRILDCDTKTPVRTLKRPRGSDEIVDYDNYVESEFYRVYSDKSIVKRFQADKGLNFLFRGPTNDIITSTVGMYGEIAHSSLKLVCKKFVEFGLDRKSVLLDLGSGRGVPNFVFATDANIFSSIGIEKCPLAYMNSVNNICVFIARDIKGIRTEIQESPSRSVSDISDYSGSSGGRRSYRTRSSSTHIADSSPDLPRSPGAVSSSNSSASSDDCSHLSVNTQREGDDSDDCLFNENSETPTRFLTPPKLPHELELEELKQGLDEFKNKQPSLPIAFVNEDVIAYDSFEGVTHFYSFDIAMERALINNMVYQFMNTSTAYVFASFISDLTTSFGLRDCFLGGKVPCRMYGSNEGKTCYIYVKNDWKKIKATADANILKLLDSAATNKRSGKSQRDDSNLDFKKLKFNVNNYDQPFSSVDIIKLSKLPLYHQYMWYLKKLDKFYTRSATRSYSDNLRETLASERDLLIEQIAHKGFDNSQEERRKLKHHISSNYRKVSRFP